jgi:hypothetical protein
VLADKYYQPPGININKDNTEDELKEDESD